MGLNLKFIAERRRELGLKQDELAEILGIDRASYCKYENGVYKLNAEEIPALAAALKCPIGVLFETLPVEPKAKEKPTLQAAFEGMTQKLIADVMKMDGGDVSPDTIKEIRENVLALGCLFK